MKRFGEIISIMLLVFGTGIAIAQDADSKGTVINGQSPVQVFEISEAQYKLVYPVADSEKIWVKIYNWNSQLVFSERIKNDNGFQRPYDFSHLPKGKYRFEIWSQNNRISKEVIHTFAEPDLIMELRRVGGQESYKLIVKGVKEDPVFVNVYDNKNGLLLEDEVQLGKDFSRIYSFNDIQGDYLTFKVVQGNKSITRSIR